MMKPYLCILLGGLAAALIGCPDPGVTEEDREVEKPRQVVVFSPHGQEILDEYEALFETAHPDIDLVATFTPTGNILGRLRIDKDNPQADVWWGGTSAFFTEAAEEGLLEPYAPTWADAVPDSYHAPDDTWYAHFIQVPAIMFNNNIYDAAQIPDSWEGLLAPEWSEKIVIREPMNSGTMKTIFSGIVWARGGEQGNPEPGYEFLQKLDEQTRSYLPNPQALYDRIAKSPAGYVSMWNLTDIIFQNRANGYPFGYRVPNDPVPVSLDPIGIVAGGPNPEEARLFYEFVTSKDSSLRLARDHYRFLARTDIPTEELPDFLQEIQYTPMEIDWKRFDELQQIWMQHWLDSIRDPEK